VSSGPQQSGGPDLRFADETPGSARVIVREEHEILRRVQARIERDAAKQPHAFEDLDRELIELRDALAEAKEEDQASLVDQMHQVAALKGTRGQGRSLPVDPHNPYFGHLRLRESKRGSARDVLIGKRTMLDDGDGLSIVDWRNAPVSRLYYRYDEHDDYEEEFDDRVLEGTVLTRRAVAIHDGSLRRINAPQGSFACGRDGQWRELDGGHRPSLEGGAGKAARVPRGQLGVNDEAAGPRTDKHLQEITALIDREQFGLITQPDSGIVLIQGGAGSGKTTVALHRVAYLAFQDAKRFAPERMIVVVFNEALVEYIRHVLPALGVEGVVVTTYRRWSAALLQRLKLPVPAKRTDATPEPVSRFKKHPMIVRLLERHVLEQRIEVAKNLAERLEGRPGASEVLAQWRATERFSPVIQGQRMIAWLKDARVDGRTRAAAETAVRAALDQARDVVSDFVQIFSDPERLKATIAVEAPGEFTDAEIASIASWCSKRTARLADARDHIESEDEREPARPTKVEKAEAKAAARRAKAELAELRTSRGAGARGLDAEDDDAVPDEPDEEPVIVAPTPPALDGEDDAILLRLMQLQYGGIFVAGKRFDFEHIVIDEAQDLCPLEVRVLLDCATEGMSVTIAGDKAQKMIFDNGFTDWPKLIADAGLPHVEIQPLKITYRSTRQVMNLARAVLGPLHDPRDQLIARDGAPVAYYGFGDVGESVAFLAEALRNLMQREPSASVALITRHPEQSTVYYEALRIAEVPRLRLVSQQDFRFSPGIDVTDVRQVKGLEFDYVVILDPTTQNYPDTVASRHLLHIASTRTAYQLWLVCSGTPSKLVPEELVETGFLDDAPAGESGTTPD
jgi:DNA helicase-2/ATP-dependent DNA helicase PcrA